MQPMQSDSKGIRTHNHLFRKQTLNHLSKLTKWLGCVVRTYLHSAFDCMSANANFLVNFLVMLKDRRDEFRKVSKLNQVKLRWRFYC